MTVNLGEPWMTGKNIEFYSCTLSCYSFSRRGCAVVGNDDITLDQLILDYLEQVVLLDLDSQRRLVVVFRTGLLGICTHH